MFAMDNTKTQDDSIPIPEGLPSGVIVSADTRRPNRLPPGQSRTKKWPILDASGPPDIDESTWSLSLSGLIAQPKQWNWQQWHQLPQTRVFSDFHCVTRWSRLGNLWEGVATRVLVDLAGGLLPQARFALIRGFDGGWTTNVPVAAFLAEDCLIATRHDGEPLSPEHGGPARLIIPSLYAWKSAKWVASIEFLENDKAGFWEKNGYHMHGDPWKEERYGW